MTDETGIKVAKARIVLEGADEYREHIQQVSADMRNLNDCIQAVNDSMKQLTKTVKGFSSLFQQAESHSDEQTKENGYRLFEEYTKEYLIFATELVKKAEGRLERYFDEGTNNSAIQSAAAVVELYKALPNFQNLLTKTST